MEVSALKYTGAAGRHGRSPLLRLQSDERLIAYVRRGNNAAFETLVSRYEVRLLSFCRHLVSSREDAEDVLQEVFAAAFSAIVADERPINVRPWLYRIVRNRSLNHLRRTQPIGVDSMDVHFSDHGASTADKAHHREEFRLLVGDIRELPESQRAALLLREMEALSYEQIAEAMETTVPSVKSLLVRARVSLAEAAEARLLSCEEVRIELGEAAEGLRRRTSPLVRRHLKACDRCSSFRVQLRHTNKALAALLPVGPLVMLKLALTHLGQSAGAGSGATAAGSGASAAGTGATAAGSAVATGSAAGGFISAGAGAIAAKAAAGFAAAALVTAGAVEVNHVATHHGHAHLSALAIVHETPPPAQPQAAAPPQSVKEIPVKAKPAAPKKPSVAPRKPSVVKPHASLLLASVVPLPTPVVRRVVSIPTAPPTPPGRASTQSLETVLPASPPTTPSLAPTTPPPAAGITLPSAPRPIPPAPPAGLTLTAPSTPAPPAGPTLTAPSTPAPPPGPTLTTPAATPAPLPSAPGGSPQGPSGVVGPSTGGPSGARDPGSTGTLGAPPVN